MNRWIKVGNNFYNFDLYNQVYFYVGDLNKPGLFIGMEYHTGGRIDHLVAEKNDLPTLLKYRQALMLFLEDGDTFFNVDEI